MENKKINKKKFLLIKMLGTTVLLSCVTLFSLKKIANAQLSPLEYALLVGSKVAKSSGKILIKPEALTSYINMLYPSASIVEITKTAPFSLLEISTMSATVGAAIAIGALTYEAFIND